LAKKFLKIKKLKKTGHVTLTKPIRSVTGSQALDIFYLHTKFGNCRFSHSKDRIASIKTE